MIKLLAIKIVWCLALVLTGMHLSAQKEEGRVALKFHYSANNKPVVLRDSSYINAFDEVYQLTRLKCYVSNVNFADAAGTTKNHEVFLLDAGNTDSIDLAIPRGSYNKLYFTVGVDSSLNNSGAQDGALDPLNGMFWTWNSGYIFFKLEGYSTASKADLNRIEHHVGGYREPNNAARCVELALPSPIYLQDKIIIHINVNLDRYWRAKNNIKIADQALLMTPGGLALKAADNLQSVFSIQSVIKN